MNIVDVKKVNRNKIYQLIYREKTVSKSAISEALGISLPTVSQCVRELEQDGLVMVNGFYQSTGGRKATMISSCNTVRVALGAAIIKEGVYLSAVDIYGNVLKSVFCRRPFENSEYWCSCIANDINAFYIDLNFKREQLLGIGVSVQGLVDMETNALIDGRLIGATDFSGESIGRYLSFPCYLQHDVEAAAFDMLWHEHDVRNALYLNLEEYMGGVVIIDRHIHHSNRRNSGIIEHMTLVPDGRKCYCGKNGCLETYCGSSALFDDENPDVQTFFYKLRGGDAKNVATWDAFLKNLSVAIYNYQLILNTDVIIGGKVSSYINSEDIQRIEAYVRERSMFTDTFAHIRLCRKNDAAIGAALYYIDRFLGEYFDNSN